MRENNCIIRNPTRKAQDRVMIGIPMTGLVRSEWMMARYGQVIPCNWSQVEAIQWIDQYSPLEFLVADARNLVVKSCVERNFEWLVFIDHDVVLPPDFILKMNTKMLKADIPVWSGLYFTKSRPSEPLIYRGRGNSYFADWKLGDKVWVDGLPMGCTAIHTSILKAMYEESETYQISSNTFARKVFETPSKVWYDPEERAWYAATGTEDLTWCDRVMDEGFFKKAGWPEFQDKKWPFLIDTGIFCQHIDFDGIKYPARGEEHQFAPDRKEEEDGNGQAEVHGGLREGSAGESGNE